MELNKAIEVAQEYLGKHFFDGLNITYTQTEEPLKLKVSKHGKNVVITYSEKVCLFRGLTFLKEKANEESFEVDYTLRFRKNGLMLDVSRNGVVTNDKVKEFILIEALMGENRLLLYTEDTYEIEKYPYFGYLRGAYSKEDIKEFVEYGESFGVELLPTIQTLAHLATALRWEPIADKVSDTDDCLLVGSDKTYEFIEEMIKTCRECYKSDEIHIGMDESTEIGLGRYLAKGTFTDRVELFTKHLAKVIQICQKYGFSPMIWSDMFFRLNDKNEEYYRNSPLPESTLKLIPKDVELVYWDYYHSDKKIYDNMICYHKDTKLPIYFAGGAWRWKGFTPSIRGSIKNTIAAMSSCIENKLNNVFVTAWGDNGNECTIWSSLPLMALYSQADYFGNCDLKETDSLLKAVTGESLERMLLLDTPDMPMNKELLPQYNPSKFMFYQDPMNGIFDLQWKEGMNNNYLQHEKALRQASKESERFGYVYDNLANLCSCLHIKVDLGVRLRKAYKENDRDELNGIANVCIPELIKRLDIFLESERKQWMKENRINGFDVIDGRFGYLKNRLLTTSKLVNMYLNDEIEKLEELENETNGNTVHQEGEEHDPLEYTASLDPGGQKGREEQCQRQLNHSTRHVVQTQQHGIDIFAFGKNSDIVLQPYKSLVLGIAQIIEAKLDHLEERNIGKQDQQKQGDQRKGSDQSHFLPVDFFRAFAKIGSDNSRHGAHLRFFLKKRDHGFPRGPSGGL
mgnify:CR=1 FL=1